MLINASGPLHPGLSLLTIGASCRYLLTGNRRTVLIGGGIAAHAPALLQRLSQYGSGASAVTTFIAPNLLAETLGVLPSLREAAPQLEFISPSSLISLAHARHHHEELARDNSELAASLGQPSATSLPSVDAFAAAAKVTRGIAEGESLLVDDSGDEPVTIRPFHAPGYSNSSLCWLIEPLGYLVVDPTFGFYRGRDLPGPGSVEPAAASTISGWVDKEISALCFTFGGVVSGDLVGKHLATVTQAARDLRSEVEKARSEGISEDDIATQVRNGLYTTSTRDLVLQRIMDHTAERVLSSLPSQKP